MTIAQVKADLPDVPVTLNGRTISGKLSGRLNPYATVTVFAPLGERVRGVYYEDAHYSWDAVCRAIDTSIPLRWE